MSVAARIGSGSTVADIAEFVGGEIQGHGQLEITGLNSLDEATGSEMTFLHAARWAQRWPEVIAGAALVTRGVEVGEFDTAVRAIIKVDNAELAMLELLQEFGKAQAEIHEPGIHPSAVIDPTVELGQQVTIGPHVSIGAGSALGDQVVLAAGVRLGAEVTIGAGTVLHANVVIERGCTVGRGCRFHPSVVIGADGFGYRPDPEVGKLLKVPHLGTVTIGDDVELGAGTCVDRAKFGVTSIGDNSKLDNLVMVAHNVKIGRSTVIAGQAGIAGSAVIGDGVQIGAHAGLVEHVVVGDGARIGAKAGVMKNVPAGEVVAGIPAQPAKEALRQVSALRKLPEYLAQQSRRKR
ncbi:MAG: UDP-3-O-(3-hydroxymyristoyl)glucosamine N-acyltransferase [Phycisphaerales bacterium]|nr:UDP-3-O-(3-hydroxymyristoyl)glucosamine N-acyltransferase [Phycisphaerales bacterium]